MTESQTIDKPVSLTPEIVRSKMQIVLTKTEQSIQALHDKKKELVFNEDNLEVIKNYLDGCRKINKTVEDERTKMKEPYLQGGRTVDAGAKLISVEVDGLIADVDKQYQKLCKEVAEKQRLAEVEKQRVATIRSHMDNFKLDYSTKIAGAKTSAELTSIERLVNLETGNKTKYAEFLEEFVNDCKAIRSLITAQKSTVRDLEDLERRAALASENGSDEEILEAMEQKEVLEARISENKVVIQETATAQATNATPVEPEMILPEIPKGGRKLWKYEVLDWKAAEKAGLTLTVINEAKVKEILADKRDKETEVTENGIRYYQQTTY